MTAILVLMLGLLPYGGPESAPVTVDRFQDWVSAIVLARAGFVLEASQALDHDREQTMAFRSPDNPTHLPRANQAQGKPR